MEESAELQTTELRFRSSFLNPLHIVIIDIVFSLCMKTVRMGFTFIDCSLLDG